MCQNIPEEMFATLKWRCFYNVVFLGVFYTAIRGSTIYGFLLANFSGCVFISAVNYADFSRW